MSFGLGVHNSPVLGLGGIMAFIGANNMAFIGTTTWVGRPTSAAVGDILIVSDIGATPGSMFMWNGTRWVTPFEQILTRTAVAAPAHTGTTAITPIISINVPGGLIGPNGYLTFLFTSTGSGAGAKLWQLTFDSTNLFHAGPSGQTWQGGQCIISNRNSNSSQSGLALNLSSPYVTGVNTPLTATIDTTVDQTLTLNATLSSAADTMTLQSWEVKFLSRE